MDCPYCHQELVEVDNPLRREVRHHRGQEVDCPGPDGTGLPGLGDPSGMGPRFVLNAGPGFLPHGHRLQPGEAVDAGDQREVRNTQSALRWYYHETGARAAQPISRTVVHQLSPLAVEGDLATFLAPPQVLAGDVLVISRSGRILWRLADGSEGGSVAGVLDGQDGPRPPAGWSMAGFTPVARLGRRPGEEDWTMGLVGEDGKLRDHDGTELAPIW